MKYVGLTGGIGAGKSAALAALTELGVATLSTDAVVHDIYAGDPDVRAAVVGRWGEDMLGDDGRVDRAAVAKRAFATPEDRQWLEGLIWPKVGQRMWDWRQAAERDGTEVAVVEVPLLFESGFESAFDATIAVVADEHVRAGRAAARGHQMVDERTTRQLSQEEKAARATFVVRNSGTLEDLEQELSSILAKLSP